MTVKELREFLAKLPDDMLVYIGCAIPFKLDVDCMKVTDTIFNYRTEDANVLEIETGY